ncbi:TPA: RNA-directed DNA polymerase [Escherichia coli]
MTYQAIFTGWDDLTIEDLLVAYRKAKADSFFENTFPVAIKFAEYEQELLENLQKLLDLLQSEDGFSSNKKLIGKFRLLPKKLTTKKKHESQNGHVHFSNPKRAADHLFNNFDLIPEFRIIGDFPVDSHIISALWINMVGHKFDASLDNCCYGARLKRIRNDELFSNEQDNPFHISAVGSFSPYFQPYQKWRGDGLKAIRDELEKDRDIIAASLDLKSYYHFIDPLAITSDDLYNTLNIKLTEDEKAFTAQLAVFLKHWSNGAAAFGKKIAYKTPVINGGLVIGLTASRIISNILLHHWDKLVIEKLSPIHYGRYVDDMFLVIRDTGTITNNHEFMLLLQDRLGNDCVYLKNEQKQIWQIQQGEHFQGKTTIQLQSDKQKLFVLQGRAGIDLLDSIEKEIYELSSEHRLMPSPDQLEHSTAAKVLSAAGSVGENADTLRRADGLTIRRLGWSLQLRYVETLARDLPPSEWKEQREEFYQFAYNHILRADNLFAHFSYLPRLLGFAISMNEWQHAEKIVLKAYESINLLASVITSGKEVNINGCKTRAVNDLWRCIKGTLSWLFVDAATRYYSPDRLFLDKRSKKEECLADTFFNHISQSLTNLKDLLDLRFDSADFYLKAPLVARADLAKEPYKQIVKSQSAEKLVNQRDSKKEVKILKLMSDSSLIDIDVIKLFLKSTKNTRLEKVAKGNRKNESYLPYIFPTRPLTPAEISELAPECVGLPSTSDKKPDERPSTIWAKYTQALRGVWIKPTLLASEQDSDEATKKARPKKFIHIGTDRKHKVVVALTSIKTEEDDWAKMACNKSNLSRSRYQRISELVNATLKLSPKPDYVLFPELSIPLRWVNSIADRLSSAGISLIAGTEYRHLDDNQLKSEAVLVLSDNRLGYPASVKIWQPKLEPAVGEDEALFSIYGKSWDSTLNVKQRKPVYIHHGVNFGVMICSELQNSKARIRFQGALDALMVLSWNKDLDTFASLIESAALDIHAYTILVNNRKYGDSRVRSPAKEPFMRDIARVKGGDNDFVVAATLDIDSLRAFQSRAKRWPKGGDKFKPLPEGFQLAKNRKKLPPK